MGKRPLCLICLLLMGILYVMDLAGFSWIRGNPLPVETRAWINDQKQVTICGEIVRTVRNGSSQTVYLKNTTLILNSDFDSEITNPNLHSIQAFLSDTPELSVGNTVLLRGKLREIEKGRNPGEFDAKSYYACKHIFYTLQEGKVQGISKEGNPMTRTISAVREKLLEIIWDCAGEEAPYFEAMLIGERGELEDEAKMLLQRAGLLHILTISGMHISILGVGMLRFLMGMGAGLLPAGFVSFGSLLLYGMLTGSGAAILRAVVMLFLEIGAKMLGRSYDVLSAMAAAVILLLLESPAWLFSCSFLLSFSAVLGAVVVRPALIRFLQIKNRIATFFFTILSIQLTTLPVMLYFYGEVSVVGIFLNLLLIPEVELVLLSGIACLFLGSFWRMGGRLAALPGRTVLKFYHVVMEQGIRIPYATWIAGRPQIIQIILYTGIWTLFLLFVQRQNRKRKREKRNTEETFRKRKWKQIFKLVLWIGILGMPMGILSPIREKNLKITCLDVGQGDGILLRLPEQNGFLLDMGSSSKGKLGMYTLLPYLKQEGMAKLDGIFVSHADQDHISGILELLELTGKHLSGIEVGTLYVSSEMQESENKTELLHAAEKAGIPVQVLSAGDQLLIGEVCLNVLSPKGTPDPFAKENETSLVLEVCYGEFQALFTGDISQETEQQMLDRIEEVDLLKVAHHGSRYSSGTAFLEQVKPKISVISCGERNSYGHPAQETIERLEAVHSQIYYTMRQGAITVTTDGEHFSVTPYLEESIF